MKTRLRQAQRKQPTAQNQRHHFSFDPSFFFARCSTLSSCSTFQSFIYTCRAAPSECQTCFREDSCAFPGGSDLRSYGGRVSTSRQRNALHPWNRCPRWCHHWKRFETSRSRHDQQHSTHWAIP